jgi:putative ABC transport system permease protein
MLLETIRLALRSVRRNALRSILTLLGIVIGVAAVIAMLTIGAGTTAKVKADISKLGSNLLVVRPGAPAGPGQQQVNSKTFNAKDIGALVREIPNAKAISAAAQKSVKIVYGTESLTAQITGADIGYFSARDLGVTQGREYSDSEVRGGSSVCLIGETVRKQFFGAGDPLGTSIRIGRMNCAVIGLLETKGFSQFGQDQDNVVLMPLAAFQRRVSGSTDIETIYVAAKDGESTTDMQSLVEGILRDTRRITPGKEDDFSVRDLTQIATAMASTTATMTGMLGAVAGISLLVGGIGIMNIMLVSVTERTREIGIRLAIGAQERDILTQFLVEATVLSLIGGLLGIALGLGLALLASSTMSIPFDPSPSVIAFAVASSALIGMVFGFFPALRGARLDPIDALRHE